jgi:dethiobiotin synthetase
MNTNKHKGLFITATDTGVGKTVISGAAAKILRQSGENVGVFKPIATGCRDTLIGLISEDTEFLSYCADSKFTLDDITPITYSTPAAPLACEITEHRKVDIEKIVTAYNYICSKTDCIIVEGIGGVRVPITDGLDVLGMAKAFDLPVIIVARPNLGTINHTLLTIEAVKRANLPLAGVIINGYDESKADFAWQSTPAIIADIGKTQILAVVPFDDRTDVEKGIIGDSIMAGLNNVNWKKIINI